MPILGIIASSFRSAAGPTGAYDSLATVTLSASTSSITFAGIPSGYKHLQIRVLSVTNNASSGASLKFNGDTTSTYYTHALYGNGTSASVFTNSTNIYVPDFNGGAATTSPGSAIIDILDYSSNTKNKVVRSLDGYDANGSGYIALTSGLYASTAPITSMTFTFSSYLSGTQFALYGVK